MNRVYFKKSDHNPNRLKSDVAGLLETVLPGATGNGSRVLIKPNFLAPASPEKGTLTHPRVLRAVAEYVLDKGGRVLIGDSPAMGSFEKILKEGGYKKALSGLDVTFCEFRRPIRKDIGKPFGEIELSREALEADTIINLPKLKTHSQMLLTLGVKNTFGCVIGLKKSEWHLKTGVNRDKFALLMVLIHEAVKPAATLLDGITALEGQGPGKSGTPRHVGTLVASKNAHALDTSICRMIGLDPDLLLTVKTARERNLVSDEVHIDGDFFTIEDFRLPTLGSLTPGPRPFRKIMRKHVIQRPCVSRKLCLVCGECKKICPASAISIDSTQPSKEIKFDYDTCIRCYCCLEICPYGAISAEETAAGKIIRRLSGLGAGS